MTNLPACLLLTLLPAAALKPVPVPVPGPVSDLLAAPSFKERLPAEQRERYATFAQRCSRCHALERALDAAFTAEMWDEYLKKKYKRAGAGITDHQRGEIGAFLRYWAGTRR